MSPDPAVEVSPVPWPMILVLATGAVSATAWGLAALFRVRGPGAASPPEPGEPGEEEGEDRGAGGGPVG